jgi:hypothetical protein
VPDVILVPISDGCRRFRRLYTALRLASRLASDEMSRVVQLAIEYDPRPPLGGIDWSTVDRDMLRPRVEGFAKEALGGNPSMLARLLG